MCVDDVPAAGAPPGIFSRGQRRPLSAGAASKVILAHLPPHQIARAVRPSAHEIAAAGLGADWDAFRACAAGDPQGRPLHHDRRIPARHHWNCGAFVQCGRRRARQSRNGRAGGKAPVKRHGALAATVMSAAKAACARIAGHQPGSARPARSV